MNSLTKSTIFSAAVVAMIGLAAVSADAGPHKGLDFDAIDTNMDGFMSLEELTAEREKRFDEMDANKDGMLGADEMKAHGGKMGKMHGDMSPAERSKKMFEHMDADENGAISPEELTAAMTQHQEKMGEMHGQGKMGKMHGGKNGGHGQKSGMKYMDTDGNGSISKAEMSGKFVERIMSKMDADKDGRISKAEAEKAGKMHKGKQ